MFRVWAVARHMIADSIRQKIALVGIVLMVAILAVLPFVTEGDGLTLTSRVQSFLAYTQGGVGAILSVVTVFLSCMAISDEIVHRRIFMIATKPIPRWQFFMGKWLGIGLLNAGLLLVCYVALLIACWGLARSPTNVPNDRETLKFEVLNARHSMMLAEPDFTPEIESRIRRMREEGRFENVSGMVENSIRDEVLNEMKTSWRSVPPNAGRRYEFKNLMVDRESNSYLHLHFKPTQLGGMSDVSFPAVIRCGDVSDPSTLTQDLTQDYLVDRWHTVPVPVSAVNKDGTLYVMIFNMDPQLTFTFEGTDTFELLYDLGTFHWNLFRALSIVWCRLAFLAMLGLMLSSWLSFPVACMGAFLVFLVSSASGFLTTAIDWMGPGVAGAQPDALWIFGPAVRGLAQGFVWLVPDFSKYDAAGNVVNGRLVPLMWVINSMVVLLFIKSVIIGALGCIILSKRELAQET